MIGDLLARTREQAERSSPGVRALAWMRIARVQTALDAEGARQTLQRGLDEMPRLSGRDNEFLLQHAQCLAAAVAPDLLKEFHPSGRGFDRGLPPGFLADRLPKIMLEHGHDEAACEYLMAYDESSTFPFGIVPAVMKSCGDATRQLAVLRRTVAAWRESRGDMFIWVFQHQWNALPPEEALGVVHEIVRVTLEQPDQEVMGTFDRGGAIKITSGRQLALFHILHVLRHLDGPLAESLIASHDQLASAVRRYPNGWESIMEEVETCRKNAGGEGCGGGFIMAGSREDFPYIKALNQASQDGNFQPAMEYALERYSQDIAPGNPNQALSEFWPSTAMFRSILYHAGKRLGDDAAVYLDRIPDPDLRLFAQIELVAALAGLPEYHGTQQYRRRSPARAAVRAPVREAEPIIEADDRGGPQEPFIRCPKCKWTPRKESRWSCKCGHVWQIFDTGGACPACLYQWKITACLRCLEFSAHSDWYTQQ